MADTPAHRQSQTIDWIVSDGPVEYATAVATMEQRADRIAAGHAPQLVWLVEHPPLYTAGTSARPEELLTPQRFPVHTAGRGGRYTYHGPGQRVVYVMLDIRRHGSDLRAFVAALEGWVIDTLAAFGVRGEIRPGRVGVWVEHPRPGGQAGEAKIAAIGIRVRRWVSFHGLSLNVAPDLEHFSGIVPCGIADHGMTSLADLGIDATTSRVDAVLRTAFEPRFGPTRTVSPATLSPVACRAVDA